jgi:hypothetical protein
MSEVDKTTNEAVVALQNLLNSELLQDDDLALELEQCQLYGDSETIKDSLKTWLIQTAEFCFHSATYASGSRLDELLNHATALTKALLNFPMEHATTCAWIDRLSNIYQGLGKTQAAKAWKALIMPIPGAAN